MKRLLEEEESRGWRSFGGDVCGECVAEGFLAQFVAENASALQCDFCGQSSTVPIAVDSDDVMEVIGRGLYREWTHPVQIMARDEGEWVGRTYDAWEVLEVVGINCGNSFGQEVAQAFLDDLWCEADPYGLESHEILSHGWSRFAKHVKYHTRYVFLLEAEQDEYPDRDDIHPGLMLQRLEEVIRATGIIRRLSKGTRFVRARDHEPGKNPASAAELGTPLPKFATKPNRMSPAGIPMFYGSSDAGTAIAEMAHSGRAMVTLAEFVTLRELTVVDLSQVPAIPSLFDDEHARDRPAFLFLQDFATAISKPIASDGREHIDYVPTQIVTDYLRRIFRVDGYDSLDGLLYRSSRRQEGECCVLFVENNECVEEGHQHERPVLLLDRASITRVGLPKRESGPAPSEKA